jgi:hypothetical protein
MTQMSCTQNKVEFIPVDWLKRSAWAARHGEWLNVYSRPVQIEHHWDECRSEQQTMKRINSGRRIDNPVQSFESLEPAELALAELALAELALAELALAEPQQTARTPQQLRRLLNDKA